MLLGPWFLVGRQPQRDFAEPCPYNFYDSNILTEQIALEFDGEPCRVSGRVMFRNPAPYGARLAGSTDFSHMLSWQQTEFLLKGVYLGLLVMIAWLVPDAEELAFIGLGTVGGLALFLGVAAVRKYREGFRPRGNWLGYLAFMLLENPGMVYAGLIVGLATGTAFTFNHFRGENAISLESLWPVLGGGVLGAIFYNLRHVRLPLYRLWLSLALALLLIGGAMAFYYYNPTALSDQQRGMIGLLLLLGIPGFFLLTFAGLVEESEIEIAAMCAALGVGTWALLAASAHPAGAALVVLLPAGIFFIYSSRILPWLRVFKHYLRGMSYRRMGKTRLALLSLGRCCNWSQATAWPVRDVGFAPRSRFRLAANAARSGAVPALRFLPGVHQPNAANEAKPSPAGRDHQDARFDRNRAAGQGRRSARIGGPSPDCTSTISTRRPGLLISILQLPQYYTPERQSIHYAAWLLALQGHPEMAKRVGQAPLPMPGERMDAIAAVETQIGKTPDDPTAVALKRQLYAELTEREYYSIAQPGQPLPIFNHEYARDVGTALLADPLGWHARPRVPAHRRPRPAAASRPPLHSDRPGPREVRRQGRHVAELSERHADRPIGRRPEPSTRRQGSRSSPPSKRSANRRSPRNGSTPPSKRSSSTAKTKTPASRPTACWPICSRRSTTFGCAGTAASTPCRTTRKTRTCSPARTAITIRSQPADLQARMEKRAKWFDPAVLPGQGPLGTGQGGSRRGAARLGRPFDAARPRRQPAATPPAG